MLLEERVKDLGEELEGRNDRIAVLEQDNKALGWLFGGTYDSTGSWVFFSG